MNRLLAALVSVAALSCVRPHHARPSGTATDQFSLTENASSTSSWDDVRVHQEPGGFATRLHARRSPVAGRPSEVDIIVVSLAGPGDYPFGFAWNRGQTRATVVIHETMDCMTPHEGGGAVRIDRAPAGGKLAPGARLAGSFRIVCTPKGEAGAPSQEFSGTFSVALRAP